ncbi:ABC transporter ATP-binding protein [Paraburkholderia sp. Ac-20336]|uniref:ABC transporter ATP-binding protein n=1 Tax=Burkholderiaceae TaxID=119060 RepID=UPI001422AC91|nr:MULTISPECIES: ABC transporter ATP-binding protein [Burkholderiaceae]MBN3801731.1 ABC transporter ATP-binding protein [Paraburkholderia sp. Ac-20336]MBN3845615.1 ABC transporter ATP-binding protein [Paraburkholderia sp. Ac-20342]NIF51053.1 ABC transporter ATP-binding protein [Burkholderia sp. Ax-1724]NIF75889.1 ABC transporter ATP-binding protein [Paraburkholderia sp. Cy-641]
MSSLSIDGLEWSPRDGDAARREHALLRSIVLDVRPGEFVGLIGPNGSGKTSLLRCAFRYAKPQRGTVTFDGEDVWAHPARWSAQRIAVLLQDAPDDFGLSVEEVVAMGRMPHKRALEGETPDDRARIARALDDVGLADLRARPFATLSGGERQRALLARALVQQPAVLMLDEPTNHLDPRHQLELLALVKRQRIATLATIHDLNLAAAFCDRLFVIHAGEIVAYGTPETVLTETLLRRVYGIDALVDRHPINHCPRITLIAAHTGSQR